VQCKAKERKGHWTADNKDISAEGVVLAGQQLQQVVCDFSTGLTHSCNCPSATFLPILGRKCVSMFLLTTPYWPHKHRNFPHRHKIPAHRAESRTLIYIAKDVGCRMWDVGCGLWDPGCRKP